MQNSPIVKVEHPGRAHACTSGTDHALPVSVMGGSIAAGRLDDNSGRRSTSRPLEPIPSCDERLLRKVVPVTAATAPSNADSSPDAAFLAALAERLSEADLVEFLLRRFHGFIRAGHTPEDAVLLAVGGDPRRLRSRERG